MFSSQCVDQLIGILWSFYHQLPAPGGNTHGFTFFIWSSYVICKKNKKHYMNNFCFLSKSEASTVKPDVSPTQGIWIHLAVCATPLNVTFAVAKQATKEFYLCSLVKNSFLKYWSSFNMLCYSHIYLKVSWLFLGVFLSLFFRYVMIPLGNSCLFVYFYIDWLYFDC